MPYYATGRLQDMVDVAACARAARGMADNGGDFLREAVERRTPINAAYNGDTITGYRAPTRPRGTARASVMRRPGVQRYRGEAGEGWQATVFTEDPVFPFIEYDTRPHPITPKRPGGVLVFWWRGRIRFFKRVEHPGTTGQAPFARGATWTAVNMDRVVAIPLRIWQSDFAASPRGRRIDSRKFDRLEVAA